MKVLVIGSGGREHALAWKLADSTSVEQVFVAPGNAGTGREIGVCNVDLDVWDFDALITFCESKHIDLTVVGPEAPLAAGIVDRFQSAGLRCLGPTANAARLESSKIFAKEFMRQHDIPTAPYVTFSNLDEAIDYVRSASFPIVIKADGLASGKGVVIAWDRDTALHTLRGMLSGNQFGEAGRRIVIEEWLQGEEVSYICLVDGKDILPMATSQDHKAAYDGDTGPNTGGMGAYSPAPVVNQACADWIIEAIIRPVVRGMTDAGTPYTGFLYAGLIIGEDRIPKVMEFNCRFGDPEAQPVLSRLRSDFASHCLAAVNGTLETERADWDHRTSLGVVMACNGYPGKFQIGTGVIQGLENVPEGIKVFHAGTVVRDSQVMVWGGRALCVTALGRTVAEAQALAYKGVSRIHWDGAWYRKDIGFRAVGRG